MALLQKGYLGSTALWRNVDWFQAGTNIINASSATTVTADASAHTKGSWSQLVSSTSANTSFLAVYVNLVGAGATNTAMLLDIGTGASGSETAIVSNIGVGGATATAGTAGIIFGFPYKIPSGTRIAARIQAVIGGDTASVQVFAIDAGDYATAPTSVDVIGGDTATSQGISFGGSSGTWTQATSSTSRAYRAVVLTCSLHTNDAGNILSASYDVGVGASGSEVAFGTNRFYFDNNERSSTATPFIYLFGRNIPAGSRLAVRHPIPANPDRYGFNLIGIP
jgi:hypothetical protein